MPDISNGAVPRRAIAAFTVLGPKRIPSFVDNTVEMFSEVGMFVSLQYQTIIKRHRERLERVPGDDATRLELGRTYVKCGLYDHAVKELEVAARNSSSRRVWRNWIGPAGIVITERSHSDHLPVCTATRGDSRTRKHRCSPL